MCVVIFAGPQQVFNAIAEIKSLSFSEGVRAQSANVGEVDFSHSQIYSRRVFVINTRQVHRFDQFVPDFVLQYND